LSGYAGLARLPLPRQADVSLEPLIAHLGTLFPGVVLPRASALEGHFDSAQIE